MKTIKFRAWSPNKNQMFYQDDQYLASFIRRFVTLETDWKTHESYLEKPIDDYLQQFTGLTDADEKEIYEGDLFRDDEGMLFEVTWDEEYLQWYAWDVLNQEWNMSLGEFLGVAIIKEGNVYENPELLKKEE